MKTLILLGLVSCLFFASAGQIFLKKGVDEVKDKEVKQKNILIALLVYGKNGNILLGFFCAVVAATSWLYALKRVPLNYALPFMALTYILVPFMSKIFLSENIPYNRWIGAFIIIFGVAISYL